MPDEDDAVAAAKRFKQHFDDDYVRTDPRDGARLYPIPNYVEDDPERTYIDPQSGEHIRVRPAPPARGGTFEATAPETYIDPQSGTRPPAKEDRLFFDDMGRPHDSYYDPAADDYITVPHRRAEAPREGEYIDPQSGEHVVPPGYRPARDVYYDPPSEAQRVKRAGPMPHAPPEFHERGLPMPRVNTKIEDPSDVLKHYETSRELGRTSRRKV